MRFTSHVSTAETDYGTVLLDQRSGQYWQLNPTGTVVVRTLLDGGDENIAIEALMTEFDVDRSHAVRDVRALLDQLRSSGLVTA
ncbi:lasso peptide biosynthesis PqqD family chaperone [Saccharopolyspora taberi]|uniref:Lasso peptide biosynthesis PqqD family chaperone n=1 Tax=Saccharopolyspora taberi TaxID=60895 RepID=A0ABN3VI83_9PSEU